MNAAQDQIAALPGTVLRVATNGDPFSPADPAWNQSFFFRQIAFATCARLVRYEDSGVPDGWTLVPEVASMPDVSADGRTYTFTIRPGFAFAPPSGEELTAETFRSTIERALAPITGDGTHALDQLGVIEGVAAYHAGTSEHIRGLEVTADGRLRITLTARTPDLLYRLAAHDFCPVPAGTPNVEGGVDSIPGSGPYSIASHDGTLAVVVRNPNYRGPRPARYDAIAIELYRDLGARSPTWTRARSTWCSCHRAASSTISPGPGDLIPMLPVTATSAGTASPARRPISCP